jgi:tRNA(fMet)-specific endonuclease VapC
MLDANLCIRVLRERPPELRERSNAEAEALATSTVVLSELLYGAAKSAKPVENRREIERFAARLAVLPFADEAAAHAGEIRAARERRGQAIGAYDLSIAGHARSRGLVVVTQPRRVSPGRGAALRGLARLIAREGRWRTRTPPGGRARKARVVDRRHNHSRF